MPNVVRIQDALGRDISSDLTQDDGYSLRVTLDQTNVISNIDTNQGLPNSGLNAWPVKITNNAGNTVGELFRTLYSDPNGDRRTIHSNATITGSGSTVLTWVGYAEWYLIINIKDAPTGSSPTIQFKIENVDPIDQTTVIADARSFTGDVLNSITTSIIEVPELESDTIKVSWTVTGGTPSFTGVNVTFCGHASGNAIEGQAEVGTVATDPPVPVAGVDNSGAIQYLNVDNLGQLKVVISTTTGIATSISDQSTLNASAASYYSYTVPDGYVLKLTSFYSGGTSTAGNTGSLRAALMEHDPNAYSIIENGDFETAGDVTEWAAVTGTVTATSNSADGYFQSGVSSMKWAYSASNTAIERKNTLTTTSDYSGYRYISVWFKNDQATGTTRTITLTLNSGSATRFWSLSGTLGTGTFAEHAWIELVCDLENPGGTSGSGFDLTQITAVSLKMLDGAAKAGNVYWDFVRLEDQLTFKHRLYTADGTSTNVIVQPEAYQAGDQLYLRTYNNSNQRMEYATVASGYLET